MSRQDCTTKEYQRKVLLAQLARTMETAASRGLFGHPITLRQATLVNGPRAGALEIGAGFESGALLRSLSSDDGAILRQLIPWEFSGEPSTFMSGRFVRVEAGWPSGMANDDIPLHALGQHPTGQGRWLVGRNERGHVLTAGLDDMTPHWLVSGGTGSGKTTALISMTEQLSRDHDNRLVLIDAKHGASLRRLSNVRGLIGPLAGDVTSARAALAWCVNEMSTRYSGGCDARRIVIICDEIQELVGDEMCKAAITKLSAQGRGARIHMVIATQHPVIASLGGPTVGRNLVGRLALRVADADASRVALGSSNPRADRLLGRGDAYAVSPEATHRTQVAYLDSDPLTGEPDMTEWPDDLGDMPDISGWPTGAEVGAAILSAARGDGRLKFQRACKEFGVADNNKAVKLLGLARGVLDFMNEHDMAVCLSEREDTPKTAYEVAGNGKVVSVPNFRQTDGEDETE
jgi:hypothetical protein